MMYKFTCGWFFIVTEIIFLSGFLGYFYWAMRKYSVTKNLWTDSEPIELSPNKRIFEELAKRHKQLAQLWFTISITILFGGVAYSFFHVMESPCAVIWMEGGPEIDLHSHKWYEAIARILPNLFLYSIFFVAWGWSLRNYRAHWHNFITNEHRYASLTAIDEIRKSSNSEEIKD